MEYIFWTTKVARTKKSSFPAWAADVFIYELQLQLTKKLPLPTYVQYVSRARLLPPFPPIWQVSITSDETYDIGRAQKTLLMGTGGGEMDGAMLNFISKRGCLSGQKALTACQMAQSLF